MAIKQNSNADKQPPAARKRGFAGMDQERQREIASQGGKAAHLAGTAHQFTSAEAKEAGAKGRESAREKKAN